MLRRVLSLLIFFALVCSASAAPGQGSGTLKLRALLEEHPTVRAMAKLLPEFENETGIEVDIEVIPFEAMTSKAALMLKEKSEKYDILMDGWVNAFEWAASGQLEPLNEYFIASAGYAHLDLQDFVAAYLNDACYNGNFYGLPVYGESTFLFYRRDIFAELGLKPPETMEDLELLAEKIKAARKDILAISLRGRPGVHIVYSWSSFLWAFGGRWLDEKGKLDIDTPEAIRAATFFAGLLRNYGPHGIENIGWHENRDLFMLGKAAMSIDATANGAFNEDTKNSLVAGKVAYVPTPVAKNVVRRGGQSSLLTHQLYISRYSRNKAAAFRFVSWATSKNVQLRSMEIEPNCGMTSKFALNSEKFAGSFGSFRQSLLESLENGNPDFMPRMKNLQQVYQLVGAGLSAIVKGEKDAEKVLPEICREINEQISE